MFSVDSSHKGPCIVVLDLNRKLQATVNRCQLYFTETETLGSITRKFICKHLTRLPLKKLKLSIHYITNQVRRAVSPDLQCTFLILTYPVFHSSEITTVKVKCDSCVEAV